jgi:hypothetical protein
MEMIFFWGGGWRSDKILGLHDANWKVGRLGLGKKPLSWLDGSFIKCSD